MEEMQLLEIASGSSTSEGEFIDRQRIELFDSFYEDSEYLKSLYMERFNELRSQWLTETKNLSDPILASQHPAYLKIIALGHFIIPALLNDLIKEKNHWFIALITLTGENAIRPEHAGDITKMAEDWYDWGRNRGFIS